MFQEPDVSREIGEALRFFGDLPSTSAISVFASSSLPATDPIWPVARALGQALSMAGCLVLTGGVEGLMGAVIEGANEQVPGRGVPLFCRPGDAGGETGDGGFVFGHFSVRKQFFLDRAKGVVFLPGGYGTLDELFFWLAFSKVDRNYRVPAVFLEDPRKPFWEPLWKTLTESLFERMVAEKGPPCPVLAFSPEEVLACFGLV